MTMFLTLLGLNNKVFLNGEYQNINCFGIELVLCKLYVTRFDLTKDLLFDTFFIAVFYKLCRCDQ